MIEITLYYPLLAMWNLQNGCISYVFFLNPVISCYCLRMSFIKRCSCFNTVECRYNAVQWYTRMLTSLLWPRQNINQGLHSQKTPHISLSRARYGVFIGSVLKKIYRGVTASHCITTCSVSWQASYWYFTWCFQLLEVYNSGCWSR